MDDILHSSATFSPCRRYRYRLTRIWNPQSPPVAFIGLNPSTADESQNDPTVRRCIDFAQRFGGGGLIMLNVFAWRSTDPRGLKATADPVGPENDYWLTRTAREATLLIGAWGVWGEFLDRHTQIQALLPKLHTLGLTQRGQPRHPLYLKRDLQPQLLWDRTDSMTAAEKRAWNRQFRDFVSAAVTVEPPVQQRLAFEA